MVRRSLLFLPSLRHPTTDCALRIFRQPDSMPTEEKTGWECRFCFEQLKRCPSEGWQRRLWFVPVRPYRCPHCFNTFQKPVWVLANIPFVKRIFCEKRGVSAGFRGKIAELAGRKASNRRNYVNPNWFVRFARWTGKIETKASDTFNGFVRKIWLTFLWPIHWLSRMTGMSNHSLPSYRPKSHSRSGSRRHDERSRNEKGCSQSSSGVNSTTDGVNNQ